MTAYAEIPQRKPRILLWTVTAEAGSRLGADGSDGGRGEKPQPPNPLPQIKPVLLCSRSASHIHEYFRDRDRKGKGFS